MGSSVFDFDAPCPSCGRPNDTHAGQDWMGPPSAGDASLCCHCGAINIYVATFFGLAVRPATAEEEAELRSSSVFREAQEAIRRSSSAEEAIRRWASDR